jgi:DNA polymerase-3 subunit delta
MWHLLYGPNDIARDEEVAKMKEKVGDAQMAALNITTLDAGATLKDIQAECDTMSFLADRRMVIVRNWLSRAGTPKRKGGKDTGDALSRLLAYLPTIPETTALVLLEDSELPATHPALQLAKDKQANGRVKFFELPSDPVHWIVERAAQKGGQISTQAAQLLSNRINRGDKNDRDHFTEDSRLYLRKLDNELEKLVAYCNGRRIEPADVETLVAEEEVSAMFKFIDAVSTRDGQSAYRLMRGILARGEQPLIVMTMLARQTRLMIMAKENANLPDEQLTEAIGVKNAWAARKVEQQARHFAMPDLERAHMAIMEADLAIKTGRMDDVTALDTLVAMLCA